MNGGVIAFLVFGIGVIAGLIMFFSWMIYDFRKEMKKIDAKFQKELKERWEKNYHEIVKKLHEHAEICPNKKNKSKKMVIEIKKPKNKKH